MSAIAVVRGDVAAQGQRPNFIHIMMDDWGWGDLGSYSTPGGGYSHVRTPNIDSLAKSGKRFTGMCATLEVFPCISVPVITKSA